VIDTTRAQKVHMNGHEDQLAHHPVY